MKRSRKRPFLLSDSDWQFVTTEAHSLRRLLLQIHMHNVVDWKP